MLNPPPARPVKAWEFAAIVTLGIPGIWLAIKVFFGIPAALERFGAVICNHFFGL